YRETSIVCTPSTLLFYPAEEMHAEQFQNESKCFIIEIKPSWLSRLREYSVVSDKPINSTAGKLSGLALKLYKESQAPDEVSPLAIEGLGLEMMAEISRSSRQTSRRPRADRIGHVRELLHAHFSERVSLTDLANSVGMHPVCVAQEFRKAFGCSVGDYVRRLRIAFACRELASSDTPLSNISAAAGFFDQSHFARTFKSFSGMTPGKYRAFVRSGVIA